MAAMALLGGGLGTNRVLLDADTTCLGLPGRTAAPDRLAWHHPNVGIYGSSMGPWVVSGIYIYIYGAIRMLMG